MDNYAAWNIHCHTLDNFKKLLPRDQLLHLCALAHLAPSTHNTQPWRFVISETENSIQLYLDRATILPASDAAGRQSLVSCGAALAHLKLTAEYYGLNPNTTIAPIDKNLIKPFMDQDTAGQNIVLATIKLGSGAPRLEYEKLVKSILKRKMVRAEFKPDQAVPTNILGELEPWADNEIVKLHLVTDTIRRLSMAEFQAQADGFVINSKKFSRELGDWLLPNDTTSYVGMPGIGFGLQDEEARRLHDGLLGEMALEAEDGLRFALGGKIGLEKSPLIGFITTKDDTPVSWLAAGEAFEKINLTLVAADINVAMHAGITEVPLIKKIFSMTLGTLRPITVLFRAGYLKNPADADRPHSPRLPLEKIILPEKP